MTLGRGRPHDLRTVKWLVEHDLITPENGRNALQPNYSLTPAAISILDATYDALPKEEVAPKPTVTVTVKTPDVVLAAVRWCGNILCEVVANYNEKMDPRHRDLLRKVLEALHQIR